MPEKPGKAFQPSLINSAYSSETTYCKFNGRLLVLAINARKTWQAFSAESNISRVRLDPTE
jgi:hypothetical protein